MANNYEIREYMHNSIYINNSINKPYSERKTNIYFSEPDLGINEDTGILLLIAGYGGNANSNIYKKMRQQFADKYNLVTIQCDYFGYEFMQGFKNILVPSINLEYINNVFSSNEICQIYDEDKLNFNKFMEIGRNYNFRLDVKEDLSAESLKNFNDMGLMQAIDNITSVLKVMSVIYESGFKFNTKKVILYGQSQGAYLSYLCNRFCPGLFSGIIDNSSWLYPQYLLGNRYMCYNVEKLNLNIEFEYLAKRIGLNDKIYDLKYLYSNFDNNCDVISFHGTTDKLISNVEKEQFCKMINGCIYNEISEEKLDGNIFKSTEHGLGADFVKLFKFAYDNLVFQKDELINLPQEVIITTDKHTYVINYSTIQLFCLY